MNFTSYMANLRKRQKAIEEEGDALKHRLKCDEWEFTLYVHYAVPRIGAWKRGDTDKNALFVIKQDGARMLEKGKYTDSWQEVEKILNERLPQELKGGMSIAERIIELGKLAQKFKEEIDAMQVSLNGKSKWLFCIHIIYRDEPIIDAWKRGDNSELCASFVVEGSKVKALTTGMYGSRCGEAQYILNKWATPGF